MFMAESKGYSGGTGGTLPAPLPSTGSPLRFTGLASIPKHYIRFVWQKGVEGLVLKLQSFFPADEVIAGCRGLFCEIDRSAVVEKLTFFF